MKVNYSTAQLCILAKKLKEFNAKVFQDETEEEIMKEILGFAIKAIRRCGGLDYFHSPGMSVTGGTGGYTVRITKQPHPTNENEFYLDLECYVNQQILFWPEIDGVKFVPRIGGFEVEDSLDN